MHKTIEAGHTFELQNRCETGKCVEAPHQALQFLKVADDHVVSIGVFTQDVLTVLIERAQYQCATTPYKDPEIELYRLHALDSLVDALEQWNRYTALRLADGAKLLGHIKDGSHGDTT